ncbi:MAG: trypsin-like peptidase domain-containing protein [Bacteroidales bacterium]
MNVILSDLSLPGGSKLFVYGPRYKEIKGAYTQGTGPVLVFFPTSGNRIIIELNLPAGSAEAATFTVERVIHGYRKLTEYPEKNLDGTTLSGSCNIDVACPEGEAWGTTAQGVVKLIINGVENCTGSLINTTLKDGRPYLLTASHCISTALDASRTLFIFNYANTVCKVSGASAAQTITGSRILATASTLDFTLVELGFPPPPAYHPLYLGWSLDTTGILNTVCIHHPSGDVKKISIDNDPPSRGDFYGTEYLDNTHWQVGEWEAGTTEGGSSGGPLLNQDHRIIGSLTGGEASCTTQTKSDFFQMFHVAWNHFPEASRQLKYWLDPLSTGSKTTSEHNPWAFILKSSDTLLNMLPGEPSTLLKSSLGWGFPAGHNSTGATAFAEPFYLPDTTLILGLVIRPGRIYKSLNDSYITLNLWNGSSKPDSIVLSQKLYLASLKENSYLMVPFWSQPVRMDSLFAGFSLDYLHSDTFAMSTSPQRILAEVNTAMVQVGEEWHSFWDQYTWAGSMDIGLLVADVEWLGNRPLRHNKTMRIFPNPAGEKIMIDLPDGYTGTGDLSIYNLRGSLLYSLCNGGRSIQCHLPESVFSGGIYLVRYTEQGNQPLSQKITIIR